MPYEIKKQGGPRPFKIVLKDSGKVVGSSTSRADAEASMRARYAADDGGFAKRLGAERKRRG